MKWAKNLLFWDFKWRIHKILILRIQSGLHPISKKPDLIYSANFDQHCSRHGEATVSVTARSPNLADNGNFLLLVCPNNIYLVTLWKTSPKTRSNMPEHVVLQASPSEETNGSFSDRCNALNESTRPFLGYLNAVSVLFSPCVPKLFDRTWNFVCIISHCVASYCTLLWCNVLRYTMLY